MRAVEMKKAGQTKTFPGSSAIFAWKIRDFPPPSRGGFGFFRMDMIIIFN